MQGCGHLNKWRKTQKRIGSNRLASYEETQTVQR